MDKITIVNPAERGKIFLQNIQKQTINMDFILLFHIFMKEICNCMKNTTDVTQ